MGAWVFLFSLLETPIPIKFLVLGGGRGFFGRGGGSANIIFMGVGIFPKKKRVRNRVRLVHEGATHPKNHPPK